MNNQLIIISHEAASQENIERLSSAGYIVIVSDSPEAVKLLVPSVESDGGIAVLGLQAALFALKDYHCNAIASFANEFNFLLGEREKQRTLQKDAVIKP